MSSTQVVVYQDAEALATAAAARLAAALAAPRSAGRAASLVLTGGHTGTAVLAELSRDPRRDAIDWSAVDLFWGDERFLPSGHPDRNETQAREVLIDHLPIPPERVHPIEPSDGRFGDHPDAAADAYAAVLGAVAGRGGWMAPDICLLGVGPDGHVASVFPASPAARETQQLVVAVRDAPKPPATRVTLTLPAIRACSEVWLMTSGADRAAAVGRALTNPDHTLTPAAGAHGARRTLWLLDSAAAERVPARCHPVRR